jgi:hypothetical protein
MSKSDNKSGLSRRALMGGIAAAAGTPLLAHAQMVRPPALPQGMNPQPPRAMQGGVGKTKVLFITKYHNFDRENLFATLDGFDDITWTHVEHPAAANFYDPELARPMMCCCSMTRSRAAPSSASLTA